jgi:DNA-binding NtrC family response regulator
VIEDPTVSRFHCELRFDENSVRLVDTQSHNGTTINGVSVLDAMVRDGSRLTLGNTTIRVRYDIASNPLPLSPNSQFGGMFGESVAMRSTFALLEKAAASDATLLLEGETGTGKTLAARSVHQNGARHDGPFVMVDCGAIPANLLESELFGHERGSFTGASSQRVGALEEASGGTLFLDEIGELPLELQPKLLGAIEGRWVRRVGSNKTIDVDIRLIVATNRNLREEVNAGRFRSDLYYRFAVVNVELPPLRRRQEDISHLAQTILLALGATPPQVDSMMASGLSEKLLHSSWPGNVRELRNYLERCMVFESVLPLPELDLGATHRLCSLPYADAKERALREFEKSYLQDLLEEHDKVSSAAEFAGIDRTYFYRLLRRNGLAKK